MQMHTKILSTLFFIAIAVFAVTPVQADTIAAFTGESFQKIKEDYAGKPFVLSLWSIDCAPCRVELELLGEIKQKQPEFPLVVISTDQIEDHEEALDILDSYNLAGIESWMFADAFVEKLRFSIDPLWHGELPRSYFFAQDHSFDAHSGILTNEQLQKYFPYLAD